MNAMTQAPQRTPLDLHPNQDFATWWRHAAELVGLTVARPLTASVQELHIAGTGLAHLLKRLQALDTPRRALLLTMACMANPQRAEWLQGEVGLHFGQLTAADLGTDVFQVLVGLLASYRIPSDAPVRLEHGE